ncbi:MAG TPA: hypothetical protein VFW96_19970, partial [Thermomicrobiales bacterium]|nr:hypothetical protein [Thermomicrobiales bacterium]
MSIETRTPETGTTRPVGAPAAGRRPDLAVLARPDSPEAEAYRALRASIKFAGGERPARSILLADAGAGDERATIAANVATALAAAGDATLLIDADLRRSAQHRIFGVANDEGVSTFLRGRGDALLPLTPTVVPGLA